jgi:glycosyltransferase involved in cell wall biosynthesis
LTDAEKPSPTADPRPPTAESPLVKAWHLVTPEFPPLPGGVSEHSRVLAAAAAARGRAVHVWTTPGALPANGIDVQTTLGAFTPADLAQTDAALDRNAAPRDILVQWVPHGFGYRAMNVHFARWVARRAAKGDRVDVMVHEPFVDYFGGSWIQPARGLVQRHMTRTVLRAARRVWMSIPGWESRLMPMLRDGSVLRVLPVPGTIPVDRSMSAIAEVRRRAVGSASRLVGYFGAGGPYAEAALQTAVRALTVDRQDIAFICIGRGSEEVASRVGAPRVTATGSLDLTSLSHHLSACDVLLQPYVDGVSGRRTTTISALEHGIPVATTFGVLSEPFWKDSRAVAVVPSETPQMLAGATDQLLSDECHAEAQSAAVALYLARFEPGVALAPLFEEI